MPGRRMLKRVIRVRQLYIMLVLPLLYIVIFHYWPMYGAQIAFRKFNPVDGITGSPWVGFHYFKKFFNSYQFSRVLKNTLSISFYQLLASFPVPIILALCLNAVRSRYYKKIVQMATYIPHFISTVVIVGMVFQIFNPRVGLIGAVYSLFDKNAPDILGKPNAFQHIYVWSGIWQNAGWNTIIYMAALSTVDSEVYEASIVDGANRYRRMVTIDLPGVLPTATVLLILNAGHIMNIGFEKVYLMQNPLNLRTSEVISTYVYKVGLYSGSGDFSYATAIGLFNSVVNLFLINVVNAVSKKLSDTSLW